MLDDMGSAEAPGREASQAFAGVTRYVAYMTEGSAACSARLGQVGARLAFLRARMTSFQGRPPTREQLGMH